MALTSDDFPDFAAELMSCATEPDFLLRLGELLDRRTGIGMFQTQRIDLRTGAAGSVYFSRGFAMNVAGEYESWVMANDPRVPAVASAPGQIRACWGWIDEADFEKSEVVCWLDRPDIDMRWGAAGLLPVNEESAMLVAGFRPRREGQFEASEVTLLQALAPLLSRTADLHMRLAEAANFRASFLANCSRCGEAAFILSARLGLLGTNAEAEALLSAGVVRLAGGGLELGDRRDQSALIEAAAAALAQPDRTKPVRPFPLHVRGRVLVGRVLMIAGVPSFGLARAQLLLLVSDRNRERAAAAIDLSGFGLTPREAELALALAGGATVQEHADARGISKETARIQLKACLQKLGVRRQSGLVRFITRLG